MEHTQLRVGAADRHVSALAADPELAELVAQFIGELAARVDALEAAAAEQNSAEVRRLAHQLRGAGGSYGFPAISEAADLVEKAAQQGWSIAESVERLRKVCLLAS